MEGDGERKPKVFEKCLISHYDCYYYRSYHWLVLRIMCNRDQIADNSTACFKSNRKLVNNGKPNLLIGPHITF